MASVGSESPADECASPTVQVPSTPPQAHATIARSASGDSQMAAFDKSTFVSPPPPSSSMTPPPSSQAVRFCSPVPRLHALSHGPLLSSPPASIKANVLDNLPTPDAISDAALDELRNMANRLVHAV